jgi:hypothetical protein
MCSCNKNKSIKPSNSTNNQKSFVSNNTVSGANNNAKKTREELLAELRRRIAKATN